MTRRAASWIACISLVGLTLAAWHLAERGTSAWAVAGLALIKVVVVGAVFLELDRSRRRWALAFTLYFTGVLMTAAWWITSS